MNIQKLQRVIVDALEDVKAQDIRVFDTGRLTSLFDRVVVASGTSNRQTRALAASVRDKVKQAGGSVISVEGEDTGEWVLVDTGDVVVHIMQPAIRQYYNLEEIWGGKPVRMRLGAPGARAGASAGPLDDEDADAAQDAQPSTTARAGGARRPAASAGAVALADDRDSAAIESALPTRRPAARKAGGRKASSKAPPVIGVAPPSPIAATRARRSPASKAGMPASAARPRAGRTA